jgi:hypothetical protein
MQLADRDVTKASLKQAEEGDRETTFLGNLAQGHTLLPPDRPQPPADVS